MRVLAFDVAVTGCSVSVLNTETDETCTKMIETERGQAELLIPLIEECVHCSGLSMKEIDMIAVTRGPGSFTGVRIGLSTARSLGMALDIPVIGVSTLDLIAQSIPLEMRETTLILIDTKRGDDYGQIGENSLPAIWTPEMVKTHEEKGFPILRDARPDTSLLAKMVAKSGKNEPQAYADKESLTPLYLREAEVSFPKSKETKRNAP